jgi:hypothetical protein
VKQTAKCIRPTAGVPRSFGRVGQLIPVMAAMLLLGCAAEQPASAPSTTSAAAAPAAPPASAPGRFDGLYVGTTVSTRPASSGCPMELTLRNFMVVNNEVRFGGFRGAIARDGSVRIANRDVLLTGRFGDAEFRGEFTQYARAGRASPGRYRGTRGSGTGERCIYATALRREPS